MGWTARVLAIAAFWLSGNLLLDLLVMPVMSVSGLMTQADFATAGYSLFWSFNRLELLCAAIILTGVLALRRQPGEFEVAHSGSRCRWALTLGLVLLSLTVIDTYVLTPEMSALALTLSPEQAAASLFPMPLMHGVYWLLEVVKVASLGTLGWLCWADVRDRQWATVDAAV